MRIREFVHMILFISLFICLQSSCGGCLFSWRMAFFSVDHFRENEYIPKIYHFIFAPNYPPHDCDYNFMENNLVKRTQTQFTAQIQITPETLCCHSINVIIFIFRIRQLDAQKHTERESERERPTERRKTTTAVNTVLRWPSNKHRVFQA